MSDDNNLEELRACVRDLHDAVIQVRRNDGKRLNVSPLFSGEHTDWNFTTFEKYINQRFGDLSLQLRERYEAQQTGVTAALAAAEKAVNAALIAAEKAVDKAEGAQQLRNEAQNEFRKSLSDLSGLMWTIKEGTSTVDAVRREIGLSIVIMEKRVGTLENISANIQGRIWAISAFWGVIVFLATIAIRLAWH